MAKRFRNEKFYRKLSKKERRQFRNNCKATEGHKTMYFVFTNPVNHISIFIGGFFDWSQTPEGWDYWKKIQVKYAKIKYRGKKI